MRIEHAREVVPFAALRAVPEMPRLLAGFLEVDHELVPILRLEDLLRLELPGEAWVPGIDHRIVIARGGDALVGWAIEPGASVVRFSKEELARLPAGHSLNECAAFVIPRPPPEPSIVLLEVDRLMLEKERICVEDMRERVAERLSALSAAQ